MNSFKLESIRKAFEASSDGWWGWEDKSDKAIASIKLCKLLNIDINAGEKTEPVKELKGDWWKKHFDDSEANKDFFRKDDLRRRSIEISYKCRNDSRKGYARISKIIINDNKRKKTDIYFTY